jgi:hypothetical protein
MGGRLRRQSGKSVAAVAESWSGGTSDLTAWRKVGGGSWWRRPAADHLEGRSRASCVASVCQGEQRICCRFRERGSVSWESQIICGK